MVAALLLSGGQGYIIEKNSKEEKCISAAEYGYLECSNLGAAASMQKYR